VGPPVPESHKNWDSCFTAPKNAVVLLFLDLFSLLRHCPLPAMIRMLGRYDDAA
jgi:hypothetical protein